MYYDAMIKLLFAYHCFRRDVSNFSLVKHRHFDGFLISMHQSGTHWLKHMLSMAITRELGLPPPKYIHANDVIGGVKEPGLYPQAPQIVMSHSIPHMLLKYATFRKLIRLPKYVVLVRDMRASLVSNYEKWKDQYGCDFSEYLRGDISGHRFNNDVWWCIRFYNAWGYLAEKFPEDTLVVKYEDLRQDSISELMRINDYWNLQLQESVLVYGVEESSKGKMQLKYDPAAPPGVIRKDNRAIADRFNDADKEFLRKTSRRYLEYSFGYDFQNWPSAAIIS